MRKLLFLALVAIFLMGCGPAQQKEQVEHPKKQDNVESPIVFKSTETYPGIIDLYEDTLWLLTLNNVVDYHYYVYDSLNHDSLGLIAEGEPSGLDYYDCGMEGCKYSILLFLEDKNISKLQFIFLRNGEGIKLDDFSLFDNEGCEYKACSILSDSIVNKMINDATSLTTHTTLDEYFEFRYQLCEECCP
jgi:hypothetical protein